MAYTLNHSNGQLLTTLTDGTIDISHTSLTLIGKDYAGYGQFLNENLIYLLENFANTTSPANPISGQLWWDTTNNILRVYSGTTWKISTGATSSPFSAPPGDLSSLGGDLWFDTTNNQLKVYSGTGWITVGPVASSAVGNSGAVPTVMIDNASASHIVIQFLISGVVYAIFSKDTFQTSTLAGFSNIVAGINFSTVAVPSWGLSTQSVTATPGTLVQRDSNGSINANLISATNITTGTLTATALNGTLSGNVVGATVTATGTISTSGSMIATGTLTGTAGLVGTINTAAQPNITSVGTLTGLTVNGATINLTAATALLNGSPISTAASPAFSAINGIPVGNTTPSTGAFTSIAMTGAITPTSPNALPIGSTTNWWSTIYGAVHNGTTYNGTTYNGAAFVGGTFSGTTFGGTNFNASGTFTGAAFSGGTFSGTTYSGTTFNGTNFLGSGSFGGAGATFTGTSTSALYADLAERYASDAQYAPGTVVELGGTAEITQAVSELTENVFGVISTDPAYLMNGGLVGGLPVALAGRVPVRVIGLVKKGDRLVSAGNGVARAALRSELTPFNVIGRAIEGKTTTAESLIEVAVKIN